MTSQEFPRARQASRGGFQANPPRHNTRFGEIRPLSRGTWLGWSLAREDVRAGWWLASLTAFGIVAWLGAVFLFDPINFVIFNPRGKTGFEMFLALGSLFGALVLALSADEPARPRMKWVAMALLVLGLGALRYGYMYPLMVASPDVNVITYGSVLVRGAASVMLAIGLVPADPPRLSRRLVLTLLPVGIVVGTGVVLLGDDLPRLVQASDLESIAAVSSSGTFPGLPDWYLTLGLIPLIAGVAAVWGAVHRRQDHVFGGWLVVAVVLFAGAQLHSMFWPSLYTSVVTTTSVLRFGLTLVVVTGGIVELRYLSLDRAALLADEQERVRQLEELSVLKRDFTSIVAHELATPLAAIGNLSSMISTGVLSPDAQQEAAGRIQAETRILQLLVKDVQASADVDREDFTVHPRALSLSNLVGDAYAYGRSLRADHELKIEFPSGITVIADPERIGQVIRNLLNNAVRHTPTGTSITLRAVRLDSTVRIEVIDDGPGIAPADLGRILGKFGRGQNARVEGQGLGLYLSQRILQSHGTELTIHSKPGHGASFCFVLKETT